MTLTTPKCLLIVYHSHTGNTAKLAEAILRGAQRQHEIHTQIKHAFDAGVTDLLGCDALLLGTPENFGSLSGALKDFFERTYYPCQGKCEGLPYALFISADNDGTGAEREINRIARGYGLRRVAETLIVRKEVTAETIMQAEILGESMAAALSIGIY